MTGMEYSRQAWIHNDQYIQYISISIYPLIKNIQHLLNETQYNRIHATAYSILYIDLYIE